jgi:hypothetical protein
MNRKAIIQVAMEAANDPEWGYDSEFALDNLKAIDPDYDWTADLLQAELESGHRSMGPSSPPKPDPMAELLKDLYGAMLLDKLSRESALMRLLAARTEVEMTGKPFVVPLQWKTEKEIEHLYPRDNPAHRERHGLEGAYDQDCNDICCKPRL